jgi:beta-ribofuranosylaminobenzene 5'-phosphate synthase
MLLDGPATRVRLSRAAETTVRGPERDRAAQALALTVERLALAGGHALEVACAMPPHAGLGSGTQLALAVAAAVRRLHGIAPDLRGDAAGLGRGARSGVGISLFEQGGLVVDGGRGDGHDAVPPVLARLAVPESWRALLLLDPTGQGLSGAQERAAFAALPAMAEAETGVICRLVLMQALPALAEADLPRFGDAITRIQERLGDYFAPAQGGRFTSSRVTQALAALRHLGAPGVGQSSWGPTGFAFARDEAEAHRLRAALLADGRAEGLDIQVRRPLNRGARIEEGP